MSHNLWNNAPLWTNGVEGLQKVYKATKHFQRCLASLMRAHPESEDLVGSLELYWKLACPLAPKLLLLSKVVWTFLSKPFVKHDSIELGKSVPNHDDFAIIRVKCVP